MFLISGSLKVSPFIRGEMIHCCHFYPENKELGENLPKEVSKHLSLLETLIYFFFSRTPLFTLTFNLISEVSSLPCFYLSRHHIYLPAFLIPALFFVTPLSTFPQLHHLQRFQQPQTQPQSARHATATPDSVRESEMFIFCLLCRCN